MPAVSWLRLYALAGLGATALAVRRCEPARILGLRFPGPVGVQAVTIGTGISAPIGALLLAWHLGRRPSGSAARLLAGLFLAGALGEPATWWSLRSPSRDPWMTGFAALNIALPVLVVLESNADPRVESGAQ